MISAAQNTQNTQNIQEQQECPHSYIIEQLSAILIQLNATQTMLAEDNLDLSTAREGMNTVEQYIRDLLSTIRIADESVPPPELVGVTLAEALSRLAEETAERLNLSSRVSFNGVDEQGRPKEHTLTTIQERVLYLVAREALYQVHLHTEARKLRFVLTYASDDVQMSIEDGGTITVIDAIGDTGEASDADAAAIVPITEQYEPRSYIDLRHRIARLGGTLEIGPISEQQKGTRVFVRLPYVEHTHGSDATEGSGLLRQTSGSSVGTPSLSDTTTTTSLVRVLVVDGQAVTRAGLHRLLESYTDLRVVGEAADGVQAVSETLELGPQVVLMDSQLPNGQSIEALRQIKQLNLDTKVLLLSAQDREEYLYETLRAGADGYVLKDITPDDLAAAIRVVARGEVLVQPQLANRLLSRFGKQGRAPYETLTARELDVLRLLARGLRNKEIAARLYVSERTVNFHLANIYQKLNVSGRTEALSKAIEQGLVTT